MKIIIPVEGKEEISSSLSRAEYFYLIEDSEEQLIENPNKDKPSGAGVASAQFMIDKGVDILLTPRCGVKAGKVLDASNIKIYKTEGNSLEENIEKFSKGKLELLKERKKGGKAKWK